MAAKQKDTKQRELIIVMVLSILLGAGGGFVLGANTGSDTVETAHSADTMTEEMPHSHSAEMFTVSADEAPSLKIMVTEDAKSGYNVRLMTENFTFTPESVNGENVIGEGHAHLYVDGEKIGRLYGPDFHYDGNFEGTKTFKATLNANDHSEYAVDGEAISAEVAVTHDSSDPAHDEMHMKEEGHSEEEHSHSDM
jgi:hypothetical protein